MLLLSFTKVIKSDRFLSLFFFIYHIYPPFTRKQIVSLCFERYVPTRLGHALFNIAEVNAKEWYEICFSLSLKFDAKLVFLSFVLLLVLLILPTPLSAFPTALLPGSPHLFIPTT